MNYGIALCMMGVLVGGGSVGFSGGENSAPQGRILPCNPRATAEDFWFTQASGTAKTMWFDTEEEAEAYQDPNGRSVYWLVRDSATNTTVSYVAGINDLWAVRFDVLLQEQCAINVTGEH